MKMEENSEKGKVTEEKLAEWLWKALREQENQSNTKEGEQNG